MRRTLFLALCALSLPLLASAAGPALADLPPPPPVPDQATERAPDIGDDVEVRIVESPNATVTEYRKSGKLYMMKVTPKVGPAYYLIDNKGDGQFERHTNPANKNIVVPQWVLFEF